MPHFPVSLHVMVCTVHTTSRFSKAIRSRRLSQRQTEVLVIGASSCSVVQGPVPLGSGLRASYASSFSPPHMTQGHPSFDLVRRRTFIRTKSTSGESVKAPLLVVQSAFL